MSFPARLGGDLMLHRLPGFAKWHPVPVSLSFPFIPTNWFGLEARPLAGKPGRERLLRRVGS